MAEQFPLLHDPPEHAEGHEWFYRMPIVRNFAAYQRQLQREQELVQQAVSRGAVPESAWAPYSYDPEVRRKIEKIVIANAYPKGSTFHPLDPVELMFVLRYGDLNELEIVMDIEKQLGFAMSDELISGLVSERTTFIEFIGMVERESQRS